MANHVEPDQLVSEEANKSGPILCAYTGHIRIQQDQG